ncbi:MAG: aryl-sulfate sulfotransferase, partial [Deltaproteobacteria bacterium]|nr:aryl-sulfate sulfotransferase [Deltaproteobacteria bacterium]
MEKAAALVTIAILFASSSSALVLPPEDITLSQIHVQFEWPAVGGVTGYDLWVVEDDGSPDPFAGAPAVVDVAVGPTEPRAVATSGLAFDTDYAWRARGVDGGGSFAWGSTYRFEIAALPSVLPTFTATTFGGPLQPGFTLINLNDAQNQGLSYAVALDSSGEVVFFVGLERRLTDLRMLPNGRLLAVSIVALEFLLNGQVAYQSPPDFPVHHEVFPMPNGNVLALTHDDREFTLDSVTKTWEG